MPLFYLKFKYNSSKVVLLVLNCYKITKTYPKHRTAYHDIYKAGKKTYCVIGCLKGICDVLDHWRKLSFSSPGFND